MNSKTAKKLRRKVYGDQSLRVERSYNELGTGRLNVGLRRQYQVTKSLMKRRPMREKLVKNSKVRVVEEKE